MKLCEGFTAGKTYGKSRIRAHAQRCGAYAAQGIPYCAAHARAAGYARCETCNHWMTPAGLTSKVGHTCPNGCAQPSIVPIIERREPPF
jgi:hypothetical protein